MENLTVYAKCGSLLEAAQGLLELASIAESIPPTSSGSSEGGWLCIAHVENGSPIVLVQIGEFDRIERSVKCAEFCQEKARRLARFAATDDHLTSRESRNEAESQYAGAIIVGEGDDRVIISFSGFPEVYDEGFVIALAVACELITPERGKELAAIVGHETHQIFLEELKAEIED